MFNIKWEFKRLIVACILHFDMQCCMSGDSVIKHAVYSIHINSPKMRKKIVESSFTCFFKLLDWKMLNKSISGQKKTKPFFQLSNCCACFWKFD